LPTLLEGAIGRPVVPPRLRRDDVNEDFLSRQFAISVAAYCHIALIQSQPIYSEQQCACAGTMSMRISHVANSRFLIPTLASDDHLDIAKKHVGEMPSEIA
jgi:hypothetical protein